VWSYHSIHCYLHCFAAKNLTIAEAWLLHSNEAPVWILLRHEKSFGKKVINFQGIFKKFKIKWPEYAPLLGLSVMEMRPNTTPWHKISVKHLTVKIDFWRQSVCRKILPSHHLSVVMGLAFANLSAILLIYCGSPSVGINDYRWRNVCRKKFASDHLSANGCEESNSWDPWQIKKIKNISDALLRIIWFTFGILPTQYFTR
jgi:hypothetical protein